ncbi:hypothetical protein K449DRAFT_429666 [Hypoxylon sp. EC38]|nr:hypothetical protein K449DRAFT_429666 [Hypoxylon sp. EC38]
MSPPFFETNGFQYNVDEQQSFREPEIIWRHLTTLVFMISVSLGVIITSTSLSTSGYCSPRSEAPVVILGCQLELSGLTYQLPKSTEAEVFRLSVLAPG